MVLLTIVPVSYTHLDVYKRQRLTIDCPGVGGIQSDSASKPLTVRVPEA